MSARYLQLSINLTLHGPRVTTVEVSRDGRAVPLSPDAEDDLCHALTPLADRLAPPPERLGEWLRRRMVAELEAMKS